MISVSETSKIRQAGYHVLNTNIHFTKRKRLVPFPNGWTQPHHCRVPEGQLLNESIPTHTVDGQQQYQECSMYVNGTSSNETTDCQHGWAYSSEYTSIVSEVGLWERLYNVPPVRLTLTLTLRPNPNLHTIKPWPGYAYGLGLSLRVRWSLPRLFCLGS